MWPCKMCASIDPFWGCCEGGCWRYSKTSSWALLHEPLHTISSSSESSSSWMLPTKDSSTRDVQHLRSRYQNLRLPNEDPCMILYGIKILSPWICFFGWFFYGMCHGIHHSPPFRRTCFGTFSSSIQHKQIPDLWETPQRLQFLLVSYTWMSRWKLVNG